MADPLCPECGGPLSPDGVCGACLLRAAAGKIDQGTTRSAISSILERPVQIGPYKILDTLGEGGMGIVYLAEQERPFRRRVALKVIKVGMDTRQVVARFEAERQALALMDHPNIAQVHDAGATDDGRPFFVMQHVPGIPITDYCDKHRLSTRARLELFVQVCAAVQHAHQKGIIHRDIKPSNVLVMVQDGQPTPKVIDFGVSKATHQRLTEKTVFTQLGLLIGTPEYMSPEQAEMGGLEIDTTTDIYSLGVLLYELLAGALPFDPVMLRGAGYAEILRIIREQEPPRPSTRLSGLGQGATDVAKRRYTDFSKLSRELKGNLDWITLKAMAKDRTRRYASALDFSADIRRHLNHEPILARRPSFLEQAWTLGSKARSGWRTMQRRQRWVVVIVVMLAFAAAGSAVQVRLELRKRQEDAKLFFYQMKTSDVAIARLREEFVKNKNVGSLDRIEELESRRVQVERLYEEVASRAHGRRLSERERLILRVTRLLGECDVTAPAEFLREVDRHIERWRSTPRFEMAVKRAQQNGYTRTIAAAFIERQLPPQYFYLAMKESDFNPMIVGPPTRFGYAKGMWQFLPGTGSRYGLKYGPYYADARVDPADERLDWEKATHAAASYIKDIYSTDAQASGLLVIASYNRGERRVIERLRKMPLNPRARNFWALLAQYPEDVSAETYDYVFSILSAAVIGENPRLFGFQFDNPLVFTATSP